MIQPFSSKFLMPTTKYRNMSVLMAVHDFPEISQEKIAGITHLSSSMVNNYVKNLKREGLLRVTGDTNRTQRYYVTARGQSLLTTSLLSYSAEIVQMFGAAKREIAGILEDFYEDDIRTVVMFGVSDTAEIVYLAIKESSLVVIGVVDSDASKRGKPFNGLIIEPPEALKKMRPDAIVISSFGKQEEIQERIRQIGCKDTKVIRLSDV